MSNWFQRFARTVESAEPGIVDEPTEPKPATAPLRRSLLDPGIVLGDGTPIPLPPREQRVDVLTGTSYQPPACTNCAGLERTVRLLEDERRRLRAQLARHELAATREQRLKPSQQLP